METRLVELVSKAEELAELSWLLRPLAADTLAARPLPSARGKSGETDLDVRVSGLTETGLRPKRNR